MDRPRQGPRGEQIARAIRWISARRFWLLLGFTYFYFHQGSDPNQTSRLALVHAIVERGATDITPEAYLTIDKGAHAGKLYSDKAPGLAIAIAPAYAVMVAVDSVAGHSPENRGIERARLHTLAMVGAGIPGVLATYFVLETLLLLGASGAVARLLTVGYGLGSFVFPFSTLLFGHVLAASLLVATVYLLQRWRTSSEPVTLRRAALLGLLWGSAIIVEYPTGMLVAVLGLYTLSLDRRPPAIRRVLAGSALGAALPFGAHVLFTLVTYGKVLTLPYEYLVEPMFLGQVSTGVFGLGIPTKLGLWGVFVSRYRGVLFLTPLFALTFIGFGRWLSSRKLRQEMCMVFSAVVLSIVFTSSYYAWDGGGSIGCRHLIPALAFWTFAIAPFASSSRCSFAITAALVALSVLVMYLSTAVIVQAPEGGPYETNPFYDNVLSSLLRGDLDHNVQDAYYGRARADASYNLGTLLGVPAMWSLFIPPLAWATAYLPSLVARRRVDAVA